MPILNSKTGKVRKEYSIQELGEAANLMRGYNLVALAAAKSGHSGGTLSIMDITAALYLHVANHDPKDPFWTTGPDQCFQYGSSKSRWIVSSVGPDLDSLDRGDIKERLDFPETLYDLSLLELKFYDPTNGTISDGDVVRTNLR